MPAMNSYPGCEWLGTSWALFGLLTCLLWTHIQLVSGWAPLGLYLDCWHACHELISSLWVPGHLLGSIGFLTCLPWTPIQDVSGWAPPGLYLDSWHGCHELLSRMWVAGHLLGSIWIPNMAAMNSYPACEWLGTSWARFQVLTCLPWTPIQHVSGWACSGLYLDCWHACHELLSSL
jgi:hypothetical protein